MNVLLAQKKLSSLQNFISRHIMFLFSLFYRCWGRKVMGVKLKRFFTPVISGYISMLTKILMWCQEMRKWQLQEPQAQLNLQIWCVVNILTYYHWCIWFELDLTSSGNTDVKISIVMVLVFPYMLGAWLPYFYSWCSNLSMVYSLIVRLESIYLNLLLLY